MGILTNKMTMCEFKVDDLQGGRLGVFCMSQEKVASLLACLTIIYSFTYLFNEDLVQRDVIIMLKEESIYPIGLSKQGNKLFVFAKERGGRSV